MAKKVLIVEDSEIAGQMLAEILADAGYVTALVLTGQAGLEKIKTEVYDAVVIDTILPDLDGFEVCAQIKKICPQAKLLVMTGSIEAVDATKARRAGADDYAVKTTDGEMIISAVKKILGD